MTSQAVLADDLARVLPAGRVATEAVTLIGYEFDAGIDRARPDAVVFPQNVNEVVAIVHWAASHDMPLVARGAGTGLSGGAVAERGGVIVQFSKMTQLRDFDSVGRSAVVEPGMINLDFDKLAKRHQLYYPPDPSSGRTSTIGGNIAENSGGPHCFKYGVTTNYVSGVDVVLADGRVARFGGRALDYPEYDFCGLINGSEGTLGIVTAAYLRLLRNPPAVRTLMAAFPSVELAGDAVSAVIARGLVPATLEMMDQKMMQIIEEFTHAGLPTTSGAALIVEVDGYPDSVGPQIDEIGAILEQQGATQLRIATSDKERDLIWYGRKMAVGAMSRLAPSYYLVDVTVPRSKLGATLAGVNQICDRLDLRVGYVFHAGDGNLHPLILIERPGDAELMERVHKAGHAIVELCVAFEGSITGEHGVGIEKRAYMPLMYTTAELDAMRTIKQVFDPTNILNPGKILPEREAGVVQPTPAKPLASNGRDLLQPSTAHEVAEVLLMASSADQSVRIRGGGSKSFGLAPCDLTLSTSALHGISRYARDDLYVTVGAGTPLLALQAELAAERMMVPLVAPWPTATVGGTVATGLNAPLRMRYGAIRDLLLATTVALADGCVIHAGRPVVKNVAGYDMPKLFAGSFGTLGVLCDLTLRLVPLPRAQASLVVPVADLAQGLQLGRRLLPICLNASALLLLQTEAGGPLTLIYTAEGPERDVADELHDVRAVLSTAGVPCEQRNDLLGSTQWATWLAAASNVVRVGVAAKDLPLLLGGVAAPLMAGNGFIADFANGMAYLANVDLALVQRMAAVLHGYAVPVVGQVTGYTPDSFGLMQRLRAEWGAAGRLNPGAFVV
jgi:D-lactate dehydrogenase (cytochrome)